MNANGAAIALSFGAGIALSLACVALLTRPSGERPPAKSGEIRDSEELQQEPTFRSTTPAEPQQRPSVEIQQEPAAAPEDLSREEQDPEEAAIALEDDFQRDLGTHARDWRDPTWAPSAEASLTKTYSEVPGTHKVRGVDCKTSSCVVDVEWPSLAEARSGYRQLLVAPTEPNCETKILLHPSGEAGEYVEKLVLDCAGARAGNKG